jgi:hypothetical protein
VTAETPHPFKHERSGGEDPHGWGAVGSRSNGGVAARCSVWADVREARGLFAATKGGTSGPYAVLDLVDAATGKPLARKANARPHRTKSVAKTLQPKWLDGAVEWLDVPHAAARLAVRVTRCAPPPLKVVFCTFTNFNISRLYYFFACRNSM